MQYYSKKARKLYSAEESIQLQLDHLKKSKNQHALQ